MELGESPYVDLFPKITGYSIQGEIMLMGDFNGRTGNVQTQYFDIIVDLLHIEVLDLPLLFERDSTNFIPWSGYGKFLLELSETHDLPILNGIARFPQSRHHTCCPHAGSSNVVDYILSNPSLILHLHSFRVAS